MTATHINMSTDSRLCPTCGEVLVAARCPECSPMEPARAYGDRTTMPLTGAPPSIAAVAVVDARRSTGEWVTGPIDHEPMTRRAHPTLVRTALAEAEERARDNVARSALVTHVSTVTRPKHRSTAQRLRAVTPLPPEAGAEAAAASAEESARIAALDARETVALPELAPLARKPERSAPQTRDRTRPIVIEPVAPSVVYDSDDDYADTLVETRRGRIFWFGLLAGVAVVLLAAAL